MNDVIFLRKLRDELTSIFLRKLRNELTSIFRYALNYSHFTLVIDLNPDI
jgi:hypothetical protein